MIELNPRDAEAYYNRGIAYMKSGNKEKACSDLKRACDLGDRSDATIAKRREFCE
jgi:Flp pilus assembly protein TadD